MKPTPEAAAEGLLRFMWDDPDSDKMRLPVDAVRIATDLGIQVFDAALDEDLSGSLYKQVGRDAEIYLNRDDSRQRQRFTAAHELGHFAEHSASGDDEFSYVERRTSLSATGLDASERYANRFAAALLMPEKLVRRHTARAMDVVEMAALFGVSPEAMTYRQKNLGLVP